MRRHAQFAVQANGRQRQNFDAVLTVVRTSRQLCVSFFGWRLVPVHKSDTPDLRLATQVLTLSIRWRRDLVTPRGSSEDGRDGPQPTGRMGGQ
jgi:hypothetical protein